MTQDEIIQAFDRMRVWQRGDPAVSLRLAHLLRYDV